MKQKANNAFILHPINLDVSNGRHQNDVTTPVELADYDLGNFITKVEINAHAYPGHVLHYEIDFISFL